MSEIKLSYSMVQNICSLQFQRFIYLLILILSLLISCLLPPSDLSAGEFRCIRGNCINGQGVVIDSNGTRFEGEFRGSVFDRGIITSPDGTIFEGVFLGNDHLEGVMKHPNGSRLEGYMGREGVINGTEVLPDGRQIKYLNGKPVREISKPVIENPTVDRSTLFTEKPSIEISKPTVTERPTVETIKPFVDRETSITVKEDSVIDHKEIISLGLIVFGMIAIILCVYFIWQKIANSTETDVYSAKERQSIKQAVIQKKEESLQSSQLSNTYPCPFCEEMIPNDFVICPCCAENVKNASGKLIKPETDPCKLKIKRLEALLADGVITKEDFELKKQAIIDEYLNT